VSLWEDNLRVLGECHPEAAGLLSAGVPAPTELTIIPTPSGNPTAVLAGRYLYGRRDPLRDARLHVEREVDPACTLIIIMGFGLGYHAEAARAAFPRLPVLAIEPNESAMTAALAARDLVSLLSDSQLHLHVGPQAEGVIPLLEALPTAKPCFIRLRPGEQALPAAYRAAEETVHSWLLRRDINTNTLNRFGRLWVRNLCRNMRSFLRSPGIGRLEGLFTGIPALVIAGGPSLDELAPHLPALSQRMLVIAVNTPLVPCLARGVKPDFTVVVDPQYWASRYLDWAPLEGGVLVAEPSTCPRVFRRDDAPFFLCSSLFPLGATLEAAVGEKGKLGAGGSVSTTAWDLARLLGARPLFAAGLDLGFPGMRTHCRGVYPEEVWMCSSNRCAPAEGWSFRGIRDIGLFMTPSTSGGLTPTDRRMLLYKWWFENQMKMHPDLRSYTLSPDGTAIEGMPLASLNDALTLPVRRAEIDERMERVRSLGGPSTDSSESRESLQKALDEMAMQLLRLEELAHQGIALTERLRGALTIPREARECLEQLDEVDAAILGIAARSIAGFLLQGIIQSITGQGERPATSEEVLARSDAMYRGIVESSSWQNSLVARAARDIKEGGALFL